MTNPAGNGYRGTVNKAASGRECMNWKDVENYTISASLTVNDISEAENYCRRVPFTEWNGPSCVTVDDEGRVRLERCNVPYCGIIFYTDLCHTKSCICKLNKFRCVSKIVAGRVQKTIFESTHWTLCELPKATIARRRKADQIWEGGLTPPSRLVSDIEGAS